MSTPVSGLVIAAVLGSAVVGGIFFAFSNFVMRALANIPASAGMQAMQSINVVVLNRWFLGVFSGTAAIYAVLAGIALLHRDETNAPYLLGAAVAYIGGTWILTIVGNVPLNQRLAGVQPDDVMASEEWTAYVRRWTRLNSQRASAAVVAAFLLMLTLVP